MHCGAVMMENVPGMRGAGTVPGVMATSPPPLCAALVTGASQMGLSDKRGPVVTILTASSTMAGQAADVHAAHICSGLLSFRHTRPLCLTPHRLTLGPLHTHGHRLDTQRVA